ncbi:ribosomal biogenesis protein LAS1L [Discoglossus pictus]
MATRRHVVAWLSKAEWDQVLEYLYSRDCKLQREALHRISAWKSRYGNKMPLAVECTADLVRCKILEMSGGMGDEELVLIYGLALVRFVNLITERRQKTVSIPLRRLANELNIPEWVVNIRHDITHGKMPKLSMCQKCWEFVMEWLRKEYWSRQLSNSPDPQWASEDDEAEETKEVLPTLSFKDQKEQSLAAKLREALRSYVHEQIKIFQDLHAHKSQKLWNPTAELEWIIAQIKDLFKQSSAETVAETFLEDGFIIPTKRQLLTLNIEEEDSDESLHLPRTQFRVWQPLLKALHCQVFTQELLDKMFTKLGPCKKKDSEIRVHYMSCWISEIITANHRAGKKCNLVSSRNQPAVKNKWKLFNQRYNLQYKGFMKRCLDSPCRTTPQLLKLIFTYMKPRLAEDVQEKILSLCSIYVQDETSNTSVDYSEQPIYTVESLEWKIKQQSKARAYRQWGQPTDDMMMEDDEEEEEEEEEEEDEEEQEMSEPTEDEDMITEESYEDEYYQMMNMKVAAERRAALQGSVWSISSEFVKWNQYPLGVVPGQKEDPNCLLLDSYSMMSVLDQQGSEARRNGHTAPKSSAVSSSSSQNLWWSQNELHHIKADLQLF